MLTDNRLHSIYLNMQFHLFCATPIILARHEISNSSSISKTAMQNVSMELKMFRTKMAAGISQYYITNTYT